MLYLGVEKRIANTNKGNDEQCIEQEIFDFVIFLCLCTTSELNANKYEKF